MKINSLTLRIAAITLLIGNTAAYASQDEASIKANKDQKLMQLKSKGGGAGKANFQDISIKKPKDKKIIPLKSKGGGAGKANFQDISIKKPKDKKPKNKKQ
jgi:hypothetical protein